VSACQARLGHPSSEVVTQKQRSSPTSGLPFLYMRAVSKMGVKAKCRAKLKLFLQDFRKLLSSNRLHIRQTKAIMAEPISGQHLKFLRFFGRQRLVRRDS
jgi:hypothetical protein